MWRRHSIHLVTKLSFTFDDFCSKYGQAEADAVLTRICEAHWGGNKKNIYNLSVEMLDREGANHRLTGEVVYDNARYSFTIENGNWNGTEVSEFELIESWENPWLIYSQYFERMINNFQYDTQGE